MARQKKIWVSLTDFEKKWLGAVVCRSDGLVGQVWAQAPALYGRRQAAWVAANGECFRADLADLTVVVSRGKQLALDI